MKKYSVTVLNALAVFVALLLLWYGLDLLLHLPPYMLPTPLGVGKAVVARFPSLLASLAITTEEAAGGLVASIVVGLLIALVFAQSRWVRRMLYPYTILLQTVPIVAVAPLILMWVGPGTLSVTLVAFIICLAPIIANTTQGLISVEPNLIHLFLMHNASRGQLLLKLRLRHAVPSLFVGIRISAAIASIRRRSAAGGAGRKDARRRDRRIARSAASPTMWREPTAPSCPGCDRRAERRCSQFQGECGPRPRSSKK